MRVAQYCDLSLAIGSSFRRAAGRMVFNYPGVGDLLLNAVQSEDIVIQGVSVITLAVLRRTSWLTSSTFGWIPERELKWRHEIPALTSSPKVVLDWCPRFFVLLMIFGPYLAPTARQHLVRGRS